MQQTTFQVLANRPLTDAVYRMELQGDTTAITRPGQFVNLHIDGCYLRRPISVCDWDGQTLTLIYKVVGEGTRRMAQARKGDTFDLLTGLGNGYTLRGNAPLLLGGGVGIPPLYGLAKRLRAAGKPVTAVLGFNTASEIFLRDEFSALGCRVLVTTADGSAGIPGFVTDALAGLSYDTFYTCGPEPMLRAVYAATVTGGQFSFEERMGCGFGACMGCSCKTVTGYKRICKDGPVLEKEEILW